MTTDLTLNINTFHKITPNRSIQQVMTLELFEGQIFWFQGHLELKQKITGLFYNPNFQLTLNLKILTLKGFQGHNMLKRCILHDIIITSLI